MSIGSEFQTIGAATLNAHSSLSCLGTCPWYKQAQSVSGPKRPRGLLT